MDKIEDALSEFCELLNHYYGRLVELNGGPPKRLTRPAAPKPAMPQDPNDVPTP